MAKKLKDFCKAFSTIHVTAALYHLRSNVQVERLVDTFKQVLKMLNGNESVDDIRQFLRIYRLTPNTSTDSGLSPGELVFARKIKSVFDKLFPRKNF